MDPSDQVETRTAWPPQPDEGEPQIPPALAAIIRKALEREPRDRFQSAADVGSALAALGPKQLGGRIAALRGRRWVRIASPIAAAVFLIALAVMATQSRVSRLRPRPGRIHSLAVLPLVNLSQDTRQEYFADGLTDGLINTLGRVGAVKVTARTSVMPFKRTGKSVSEIAHELGVDAVVEGSAALAAGPDGSDRVRVAVSLIDPATQTQLWSDSIERDLVNVLSIQSEIARALAEEINVAVTPDERIRLAAGAKVNPEAYKLYLLGRQQWTSRTVDSLQRALDYFRQAVTLDSGYAPAYAGLADTYVLLAGDFGAVPRDAGAAEATATASRALALDPTLAEAYTSLAFTNFFLKWDWSTAEEQFRHALRLNPSYATAHHWFGNFLSDMGREDEGLEEMRRALELDPLSPIISRDVAWPLFFARRYDAAIQQLQTTLAQHPGYLAAERLIARSYVQKGAYDEALRRFESLRSRDDFRIHLELAWAYARAGRSAEAARAFQAAQQITSSGLYPYDLALVFTAQNRIDDAFAALTRAFEERDPTMVNLKHDPRLDPLRPDARYQKLLALMRFPQ